MNRIHLRVVLLMLGMTALQGCIAFPPLISVEHKHEGQPPPPSNEEVIKRLDTIDQRLNNLETKQAKP